MRRLVLEDPFARSAVWSRNLAVFALVVALIGIGLSRKGLEPKMALAIVGASLVLAAFAVLFALIAMAVIWRTGFRGIGLALGGLVLSALLFAYPTYLAVQARTAPALSDASTDVDDPPPFLTTPKALAARRGWRPPTTMSQANRDLEDKQYPDLQTVELDADPDDVEDAIHKLIKRHHWTLVDEVPTTSFSTGHIDAVVKSTLMGFPADVTFRIRALGSKVKVDIRSVSRAGWQEQPDANGERVEDLASSLEDAIGEG